MVGTYIIGQTVYYKRLECQVTIIDTVERPEGFPPAYKVETAEAEQYWPVDEDELSQEI